MGAADNVDAIRTGRFQAQGARAIDLQFQRLVIDCAEEIRSRGRSQISIKPPGIEIRQAGGPAAEGPVEHIRPVAEAHCAVIGAAQPAIRNQAGHGRGRYRIRCSGQFLPRI